MTIWISGDHHFGHANILKYCRRKFTDIEEHDRVLIQEWNKVVAPDDEVFYLGDFTLGNRAKAQEVLEQLHGEIFLLSNYWHHDKRWMKDGEYKNMELMPSIISFDVNVIGNSMPIVLCHFPFEVWDRKHYGAVHFHGHSHGELHRIHNRLDVGVDMAYKLTGHYRPLSIHEATSWAVGFYEETYNGNRNDETATKQ